MKKIDENLYLYKGIEVKKLSNGNYIAEFHVNSVINKCKVCGSTQANFKKLFNEFVRRNKGLKINN